MNSGTSSTKYYLKLSADTAEAFVHEGGHGEFLLENCLYAEYTGHLSQQFLAFCLSLCLANKW
jgi:hypothetical protein